MFMLSMGMFCYMLLILFISLSHCIILTRICFSPCHLRNDGNARDASVEGSSFASLHPPPRVGSNSKLCRQTREGLNGNLIIRIGWTWKIVFRHQYWIQSIASQLVLSHVSQSWCERNCVKWWKNFMDVTASARVEWKLSSNKDWLCF